MKKFFWNLMTIVMVGLMSAALNSCGKDDEPVSPTLSVDETAVSFNSNGGTTSIGVVSNTSWSVSGGDNWLSVSKSTNSITLIAQRNESTEEKTTSVTVRTDDGSLSQAIKVTVAGAEQILELSGLDAPFAKEANGQAHAQELTITCNASWVIEGKPDWLSISNMSGTGDKIIKVWPTGTNNSTERRATFIVKSGIKSITKEVVQHGISSCYAHPVDVVTLTESSVWGYEFSNNIHHVYFTLIPELEANGLTNSDIEKATSNNVDDNTWVRRTPEQFREYGNYFSWYGLPTNKKYMLISVAYDNNNEIGEINRMAITTKVDDLYNSPYIDGDYISASLDVIDDQFVYRIRSTKDAVHSAYADKFYSWAVVGTSEFKTLLCTGAQIAFLISQEIKKNPAPHDTYINDTDRNKIRERLEGPVQEANYTLPANLLNDAYLQVVNWCILPSGEFSGKISWYWFDLMVSRGVDRKATLMPKKQESKTPKLIQFNPQQLKQEYKVIKLN